MSHSDCFVVKTTHFSGQLTGSPPQAAPPESDRTAAAQRTHPGPTDGPLGRREMAEAME